MKTRPFSPLASSQILLGLGILFFTTLLFQAIFYPLSVSETNISDLGRSGDLPNSFLNPDILSSASSVRNNIKNDGHPNIDMSRILQDIDSKLQNLSESITQLRNELNTQSPDRQCTCKPQAEPENVAFVVIGMFLFVAWVAGGVILSDALYQVSQVYLHRVLTCGVFAASLCLAVLVRTYQTETVEQRWWFVGIVRTVWSAYGGVALGGLVFSPPAKA